MSSPFEELGQRQTQPDCRDCASAEKSGPNERETVGMRLLRKKGPLPCGASMRSSSGPNEHETAGRKSLRKKDRCREQPPCEARAGLTSARLQGGGRCGKRTAPVSSPYARLERAQRARDCREEAAAEKGQLRRAAPTRGSKRREAAGRRPLREKDRCREHPLCEARAGLTNAKLQRGGRC